MRKSQVFPVLPVLVFPLLIAGCGAPAETVGADSGAPAPVSAGPDSRSTTEASPAAEQGSQGQPTGEALAELEERFDGRVGVYAVDTGTGEEVAHRADERFGHASTHKVFSAGAVLAQSEPEDLDRRIHYSEQDLVVNSPITEQHVDSGLTLREVIRAAVSSSDNTAGNLLLDELGGPEGLQAVLSQRGDRVTSVDREEPELNEWAPGATLDTTTPRQAAANLGEYALGDTLEPWAREEMLGAMRESKNSEGLIRAAVPAEAPWTVANKSGAGLGHGTRHDIAVVEREDAAPLVVAVYTNLDDAEGQFEDAFVAEAAAVALEHLD